MQFAQVNAQYYCGIDLHSKSTYVCVMDKDGEIQDQKTHHEGK